MPAGKELGLAWQSLTEFVHQPQGVAGSLVGQMQVNHGAGNLGMAEQLLNRVQMRARFKKVSCKTVPLMPGSA